METPGAQYGGRPVINPKEPPMLALTEATVVQSIASLAIVLAAVVPTLITIWKKQNQVHNDNRADHAATAALVKEIHSDVGTMREDLRDTKADVRAIKDDVRNHSRRLSRLETTRSTTPSPAIGD